MKSLTPRSESLITATGLASEPVPAVVGIAPSGASGSGRPIPSRSRGSWNTPSHSPIAPPWLKTTLAPLVVSITDPPPTARKLSAPASAACSAHRATTAVSESCGTSSKTPATSSPPSATPASTFSTSPVPRITWSVTNRTRPAPSLANSKPALPISSRPETTRVGEANW